MIQCLKQLDILKHEKVVKIMRRDVRRIGIKGENEIKKDDDDDHYDGEKKK